MMRLSEPKYSFETTLDECIAGIERNNLLLNKLSASKSTLITGWTKYLEEGRSGTLHTIQSIPNLKTYHNVRYKWISYPVTLDKSELINIYETYFVPEKKPARKIYDALLNAAQEQCPFCGGIGTPRNLDHFLPKSHFPQFSILPHNLVPSCRDCNMDGKGQGFARSEEEQIIQPYADKNQFFSEQWIFATYHDSNGVGEFEYYVAPPNNWTKTDKARVRKHFKDFNLAKRYGIQAGRRLVTALCQIENMKKSGLSREIIEHTLLQPEIDTAPFINHWQKGMYQALIKHFENVIN